MFWMLLSKDKYETIKTISKEAAEFWAELWEFYPWLFQMTCRGREGRRSRDKTVSEHAFIEKKKRKIQTSRNKFLTADERHRVNPNRDCSWSCSTFHNTNNNRSSSFLLLYSLETKNPQKELLLFWNKSTRLMLRSSVFPPHACGSSRCGQQVRGHVSDGAEGQAAKDTLVCCLQFHQSVQNRLAVSVWVELRQLGHQGVQAAHGAKVLRHAGSLCSGQDAHHLLPLDAGADWHGIYQLYRYSNVKMNMKDNIWQRSYGYGY